MGRCSVIIDSVCAEHENPHHPECNARLLNAYSGVPREIPRLVPTPALIEDVAEVHDRSYLAWLEQRCSAMAASLGWLDSDTYITKNSFLAALHAAGGAIAAVERSLNGEHSFALVRPPGHHAEFNRAMGFCLMNNVAVAAKKALKKPGTTVAIVDWDIHHGNGTQDSFYGTDRVLYCSVHQEHIFPYRGTVDQVGLGEGKGYTINAPLRSGSVAADYEHVFSEIFVPAIERFSPNIMIVSVGQDILSDDPLGMMGIIPRDFEVLTRMLVHAARVPLALVLEGGYGPSHGEAVRSIFAALMSKGPENPTGIPSDHTQSVVSYLKSEHDLF